MSLWRRGYNQVKSMRNGRTCREIEVERVDIEIDGWMDG